MTCKIIHISPAKASEMRGAIAVLLVLMLAASLWEHKTLKDGLESFALFVLGTAAGILIAFGLIETLRRL